MGDAYDIRVDDLTSPQVMDLLHEHHAYVIEHSPPESVHALDVDGLRAADVTFWCAWDGDVVLGCGALKQLDPHHGEIKSMRTRRLHQRRGVGTAILRHMLAVARQRGYRRISLETGSVDAFHPAHALYKRFGFQPCDPFADYIDDGFSIFMTLHFRDDHASWNG